MITETITHICRKCQSTNLTKNGTTAAGKQKYRCSDCGSYATLVLTPRYSDEFKEQAVAAYQERVSQRGVSRLFGIARQTLVVWSKKNS